MKKILVLCSVLMLVAFVLPLVAEAAVAAGTANPYHVKVVGIKKRVAVVAGTTRPWTFSISAPQTDSTDFMLKPPINVTSSVAQPDTTNAISIQDMVYPATGAIYAGVFLRMATADSVIVQPQVSQDGLYWISLANVSLVGTTDFDPLVEAQTTITTPMWKYMRWIMWSADYVKAPGAVSTAGVRLWFSYYEKDR
jgi:hypothetical protein